MIYFPGKTVNKLPDSCPAETQRRDSRGGQGGGQEEEDFQEASEPSDQRDEDDHSQQDPALGPAGRGRRGGCAGLQAGLLHGQVEG